jgi:hypothetical protein
MKTLGEMVVKSDVERAVKTCVKIAWNLCEKKRRVFIVFYASKHTDFFHAIFTQLSRNFHGAFHDTLHHHLHQGFHHGSHHCRP